MTTPGLQAPGVPVRCVGCGKQAPAGSSVCPQCRSTLAHVCYGKLRLPPELSRAVVARERAIPGRENTVSYRCPVCRSWHLGRTSGLGEVTYADAVLICLRLLRFHGDWLAELAESWHPDVADRLAWREVVSPRRALKIRAEIEEGMERDDSSQDPLPA